MAAPSVFPKLDVPWAVALAGMVALALGWPVTGHSEANPAQVDPSQAGYAQVGPGARSNPAAWPARAPDGAPDGGSEATSRADAAAATRTVGFTPLNKGGDTLTDGAILRFLGVGPSPSSVTLQGFNPRSYTAGSAQVLSRFITATPHPVSPGPATVVMNGQFYSIINTPVPPAPNNAFIWSLLGTVNYASLGGGTGQHVGIYGQGVRSVAAPQATRITAASASTTVAVADTTAFQSSNGAPLDPATVRMPILINGHRYYCVGASTTSGPGTITLASPVSAADGAAGNEVDGLNNPQIWGGVFEAHDLTKLPSSKTNALVGLEVDVVASGSDDAENRSGIALVGGSAAGGAGPTVVNTGIGIAPAREGDSFNSVMTVAVAFNTAILDFRYAKQGAQAHAIWMKAGQDIAFGSAAPPWAPTHTLASDGTYLNVSGPLVSYGKPRWSSANYGRNLLLASQAGPGAGSPALAIADAVNRNLWGIANVGGSLTFAAMPAYGAPGSPFVVLRLSPMGVELGSGTPLATNAGAGFALLPTMAGAPIGTAGAVGKAAVVIDTKDDRLCWSTGGGSWKCVMGR